LEKNDVRWGQKREFYVGLPNINRSSSRYKVGPQAKNWEGKGGTKRKKKLTTVFVGSDEKSEGCFLCLKSLSIRERGRTGPDTSARGLAAAV